MFSHKEKVEPVLKVSIIRVYRIYSKKKVIEEERRQKWIMQNK